MSDGPPPGVSESDWKSTVVHVGDWIWGTVEGSFNEKQSISQMKALSHVRFAFDLLLEFGQEVGALDAGRADELRAGGRDTLHAIGEEQGTTLKELEPAERFIAVLGTLLEQKRIRLVERGTVQREDVIEAIGWYDEEYAYLLPDAARRRAPPSCGSRARRGPTPRTPFTRRWSAKDSPYKARTAAQRSRLVRNRSRVG